MFSYFSDIKKTKCEKTIDLTELVEIIRVNHQKQKIKRIRELRKNGFDKEYIGLKKTLPNITPNCNVSIRSLEGDLFEQNFRAFSGYIYIDLDVDITETIKYKDYFIKKYGHLVSMVCLSSSMGGISVLFKVDNTITKENFEDYWNYIKLVILAGEPVDDNSDGIGRAMFISHDPDLYFNPNNSIEIDSEKCLLQGISRCNIYNANTRSSNINNTLKYALSIIPIKYVLQRIKTSTSINNVNTVLDYFPIDFTSSRFPNKIKDGYKRKLYPVMIHRLVFLNQDLHLNYIYSYLHFVNQKYAEPPMEQRELDRLFRFTYSCTQQEGYEFQHERIKYLHFNPDANLTGDEKRDIANQLNGKKKKNGSIEKIQLAKEQLQSEGKKITKAAVARISGLTRKTVIQHFDSELIDIEEEVLIINDSLSTRTAGNEHRKISSVEIDNHLQEEYIHPDCPEWIFEWERRNSWKNTG